MKKEELSAAQLRTITALLESNSIEEAARRANVSRATIYNWQKQPLFSDRLEQERKTLFDEGLSLLKGATTKAAKTLIELLKSSDTKIRRLAAKEILNFAIKAVETQDLEERINILEEMLEQNKDKR
ncbi:hypothetical protein ACFLRM_05135 [Acidobacteriota bacterium]